MPMENKYAQNVGYSSPTVVTFTNPFDFLKVRNDGPNDVKIEVGEDISNSSYVIPSGIDDQFPVRGKEVKLQTLNSGETANVRLSGLR